MHLFAILFFIPIFLSAQESPSSVLAKVDAAQRNYKTFGFKSEMKIENMGRTLLKNMFGFTRSADDNAFIEYTNPQDFGTRYLKLSNDMWIYSPDAQDVLKLSGHLLRDSMMGSDVSYNDIMERSAYKDKYIPTTVSETNIDGTPLLLLVLMAKDDSVSYARQDLFVQQQGYLIRKIILYAKGRDKERAIKEFEMDNYKKINNVDVAMLMKARDLRKKNSQTTINYTEVTINPQLDVKMFTRSYLER